MLPREFLELYGYPVARSVRIAATGDRIATPNPDRYLLVIGPSGALFTYKPVADGIGSVEGLVIPSGEPFIITHALHGSLVNMGFEVQMPPAGFIDLLVIEGFMIPQGINVRPAVILDPVPQPKPSRSKPWRTLTGLRDLLFERG